MSAISPKESVKSQSRYQLIYALCPLTLQMGNQSFSNSPNFQELLVIEQASPFSRDDNHVFTPIGLGSNRLLSGLDYNNVQGETFRNGAHKQSIEEQEKAKFSFSGATLYGINAVIGSEYLPPPQKFIPALGPASLAVMFGVAISRHATINLSD